MGPKKVISIIEVEGDIKDHVTSLTFILPYF